MNSAFRIDTSSLVRLSGEVRTRMYFGDDEWSLYILSENGIPGESLRGTPSICGQRHYFGGQ